MATQAAQLALANGAPRPEVTNMFSPTLVRRHSVAPDALPELRPTALATWRLTHPQT